MLLRQRYLNTAMLKPKELEPGEQEPERLAFVTMAWKRHKILERWLKELLKQKSRDGRDPFTVDLFIWNNNPSPEKRKVFHISLVLAFASTCSRADAIFGRWSFIARSFL